MAYAPRTNPGGDAAPAPTDETSRRYTITDLAREFHITARTIRFYEDLGILSPARAGRQRIYSQGDRIRLSLTLRGKRLGLSLHEVKQLVLMYESPADTEPQLQAFLRAILDRRAQLERQMVDLRETLGELSNHEQRCRTLLQQHQNAAAQTR